jgi:hypothetical protein
MSSSTATKPASTSSGSATRGPEEFDNRDIIAQEIGDDRKPLSKKLSRYLLVKRSVGDKSEFLKRAGYTIRNANTSKRDIRSQILSMDLVATKNTSYGQHFEIRASDETASAELMIIL